MSIIQIQGEIEKRRGICYQFDTASQPIGEGGMGKVYEGIRIDTRTGATRPVAIKCMFDDLPESAYLRARREAEIQLRNDNLIEMLGFIEIEASSLGRVVKNYFVVSELLDGVSLSDMFEGKTKNRLGEEIPFVVKMLQDYKNDPEHFAKTVVVQVLSGLMALHDAGYIHRDIDPSNIMLTTEGHVKLIDFGIAKQMNSLTTGDKGLTVAGKFMGKPEYAAPELALGDIAHQNQTTDIYAVGILLYECILGHPPFEGPRHEVLEKQIKSKMPLGKIKDRELRNIIATACMKKQELRYQSSAQMRVALETLSGKRPMVSLGKKKVVAAIVAAVVVMTALVCTAKYKQNEARKAAEIARVEQQRQEVNSGINDQIDEGERLLKQGLNKENDNYETMLMSACKAFMDAEKTIKASPFADYPLENLNKKKQEVIAALDSAEVELGEQASMLEQFGEASMAEEFKERVNKIVEFKSKLK